MLGQLAQPPEGAAHWRQEAAHAWGVKGAAPPKRHTTALSSFSPHFLPLSHASTLPPVGPQPPALCQRTGAAMCRRHVTVLMAALLVAAAIVGAHGERLQGRRRGLREFLQTTPPGRAVPAASLRTHSSQRRRRPRLNQRNLLRGPPTCRRRPTAAARLPSRPQAPRPLMPRPRTW